MRTYSEPVISRETRRLMITVLISIAALWLLARVRFQERAAIEAPVTPVLAQLRPQSSYDDLARSVSDLRTTLAAVVAPARGGRAAWRIDRTAGVAIAGARLEIVPLTESAVAGVPFWQPRSPDISRYFVAADVFDGAVVPRPVFAGSLAEVQSELWASHVWRLPSHTSVEPGTFLFTLDGSLAGAVVHTEETSPAILPAAAIRTAADRLRAAGSRPAGHLGLEVAATHNGVGIVRVAGDGPAAGRVGLTEIVEAIDGRAVTSLQRWQVLTSRFVAGQEVLLRVRGLDGSRDVPLVAAQPPVPLRPDTVGLHLQRRREGAAVTRVDVPSVASLAGMQNGDVIVAIDGRPAPTPAQVLEVLEALPLGGASLLAVRRAGDERVVVFDR